MKFPEDIHIPQSQIKFADSPLPLDVAPNGFTVDSDANYKNAQIMLRLKSFFGQLLTLLNNKTERMNQYLAGYHGPRLVV